MIITVLAVLSVIQCVKNCNNYCFLCHLLFQAHQFLVEGEFDEKSSICLHNALACGKLPVVKVCGVIQMH